MKQWYCSTNLAQRIFMFVVAIIPAIIGLVNGLSSPFYFVLSIPLLLLIYLQLGAPRRRREKV
ncbi:hypothetical protein CFB82_40120 [Burkholderia sp. HI2714]|uniref:hypothetical protein n=1 Tax=Burkholderia sp. HI2714 TaxID=2015359 RepID=UPI000B79BADA|nr:hypothetical protein [Burkholderia sp. HI2714]OXJ22568.1 hypothetical protein CFB82_40120 [Burkholderia sp. HI2714]